MYDNQRSKRKATNAARLQLLTDQRNSLLEQKSKIDETLERLNYKISRYEIAVKTGMLTWEDEALLNKNGTGGTFMSKILIVYYLRKGENYWNGIIKSIAKGNTERIAEFIQKAVGGDLFEVDTVRPYDKDYYKCIDVAKKELHDNAHPENFEDYDTIFVGYPNWWGTMPMCMFTLLENYDMMGKTIIPFCTNEGSGMGSSERDLKNLQWSNY